MTTKRSNNPSEPVLFQSKYGSLQPRYLWFLPVLGLIGLVGVPVGIFYNEGWVMNNHPLEPWSATLIIEIFSVGALLIVAAMITGIVLRRKSPQRVVVTKSAIMVPKGMFSNVELVFPFAEIDMAVFNPGLVKQLQIKHKRRKILLSSAMFPTTADFDRMVGHLPL